MRSLRISVTDRCNLRCQYCMPEPEYVWLPRENLLSFEEIAQLTDAFTDEGVNRVRITGGEPLLRRNLPALIESLAARPAVEDLALTTNGILLKSNAAVLKRAGLHRITVSLDTLKRDRFRALTGSSDFDAVLAGIHAAADAFGALKIDTVAIRGTNDDELVELLEFGRTVNAEVRFIEYMDVGGATRWSPATRRPARRDARESSDGTTAASSRSRNATRHPPSAFCCRTAQPSASSRRRRRRSARPAIAPG